MTDQAVGNRAVDGVNPRDRLRPKAVEMIANAHSSTHAAPHECGSANEAVDLLRRLLL